MNVIAIVTGNHQAGHERSSPIAEKKNQDDGRQNDSDQNRVAHALDRIADDLRLIVKGLNPTPRGNVLLNRGQFRRELRPRQPRCCYPAAGRY